MYLLRYVVFISKGDVEKEKNADFYIEKRMPRSKLIL